MINSLHWSNERADQHCAESTLSNLVKLGRHQICEDSSTEPHHLVKPSRSQRCFSQFDRNTDCFDGGLTFTQPDSGVTDKADRITEVIEYLRLVRKWATFKAVCSTQTRQGGSLNKNQPDCQQWLEICIGPTAVCKCSPRTGTYVDWGPEYTYIPNVERAGTMTKGQT